jgi:hypothetical protein
MNVFMTKITAAGFSLCLFVCSSVIVIRLLDCLNTNCGIARTGNRRDMLFTDTHSRHPQFNALTLISQNSTYFDEVLQ